ncbi:unnamed protein product [Bursaphelenchus xylophilus]|uniref:(pine wood nematode) hypothetical protein n=1 Tax=Bursaphelenchus xylophilus TaxID=6326 RepID=A0A1I7SVR0_BURXY|nr:unnamed protein product [Bursaphelenchus xylophilus]CAG9098115.1 unnamed protein product [Bursaphelenchus xylophilus]
MEEEILEFEEIEFHNFIRKHVVCLLFLIGLYFLSFQIIQRFKTRSDNDDLYSGDEDFIVYRISVWMCTFSLAVSIGAITLLPFSVLGSEVLLLYPDNFYFKWLNMSLISSLWNYIFLLSNVSLFFLLPFAYFFLESQGLSFHHRPKPFLSRVYETIAVCVLVFILMICLANVAYSLYQPEGLHLVLSLLNFSNLSIPLVYSLVSLVGVALLLISTPIGFAKMFDFATTLLIDEEEEVNVEINDNLVEGNAVTSSTSATDVLIRKRLIGSAGDANLNSREFEQLKMDKPKISMFRLFFDTVKYPVVMVMLVTLTVFSVSIVLINTFKLTFGFRELNEYVQYVEVRSRHRFGIPGALVENLIIVYIFFSALVGVYSMPLLRRVRPKKKQTSMTNVIANCVTILMLSSALPILANTLGITSFDLLGGFGHLNWISNFSLVWFCNIFFAIASSICLLNKFTFKVRVELWKRISQIGSRRTLKQD